MSIQDRKVTDRVTNQSYKLSCNPKLHVRRRVRRRKRITTESGQNVDNFLNSKKYTDSHSTKYSKKQPSKIGKDLLKELNINEPDENPY
ncbi:hypothetical protein LCGC14_2407540 [marine sediment metagenome]|uniref:Uncharacterized protein n=1 Tax=marine sediment metagenome TaxID=412755 RepID=A0A0F9EMZ9_9ZZZZ